MKVFGGLRLEFSTCSIYSGHYCSRLVHTRIETKYSGPYRAWHIFLIGKYFLMVVKDIEFLRPFWIYGLDSVGLRKLGLEFFEEWSVHQRSPLFIVVNALEITTDDHKKGGTYLWRWWLWQNDDESTYKVCEPAVNVFCSEAGIFVCMWTVLMPLLIILSSQSALFYYYICLCKFYISFFTFINCITFVIIKCFCYVCKTSVGVPLGDKAIISV